MTRDIVAAAALLTLLASCARSPSPKAASSGGGEQRAPLTQWFYADGRILPDDTPPRSQDGDIRSPAREWLVVANLAARAVSFTATFYFEDTEPRSFTRSVAPRRSQSYALHEIPDVVPPGKLYGAGVESDGPILVQPSRGEYEPHNPVTAAMSSFIAYPGPLGMRETRWAYADGLVLHNDSPLEEREWISILNPSPDGAARVRIRFLRAGRESEHRLDVPSERVRSVDLYRLKAFPRNSLAGIIVASDRPVVVQQIRRAYTKGIPVVASLWATLAHPIGDREVP